MFSPLFNKRRELKLVPALWPMRQWYFQRNQSGNARQWANWALLQVRLFFGIKAHVADY